MPWLAYGLLAGGVAACSFAPAYRSPPASGPPPAAYREAGDWLVAAPRDVEPRGQWWTVFADPALDELEVRAGAANQDILAAAARLQQARAAARVQRAALLPNLNLQSSATRARASVDSPRFPAGYEPVGGNFDLEADFAYEVDLWGRVRNSLNSARANQQASAADLASLDLSMRAELAADYFNMRGEDAQQALLDRTVEDYTKALELTGNRYAGGAAAVADVEQARAQLETARTQAAEMRLARSQVAHVIAVLVGENPSVFNLSPAPLPSSISPPVIDPGLPSTLLERRPDVAAAERRVAAANFNVGVARAAYFPVFSLAAAFGYDSEHAANWLTAPSRLWSIGPSAMLTAFDAGRHRAQSAQALAAVDEQAADYRNVVLTAFREVEDELVALRELERESVSQAAAVTATGKALQQAEYRYQAGLVTYLEVATIENANLQAQLTAVSIQIRRMTATVMLVKALGGGWRL